MLTQSLANPAGCHSHEKQRTANFTFKESLANSAGCHSHENKEQF